MSEKQLTTEQSLDIISKMIANTRRNFGKRTGVGFLIGGYTTIAVAIAVGVLDYLTHSPGVQWLWFAVPVIVGIFMWFEVRKHERRVQTHLDKTLGGIWAIFFSAAVCCMVSTYVSWAISGTSYIDIVFAVSLMLCICMIITGLLIKFYPVSFMGFIGMGLTFAMPAFTHKGGSIWQLALFVVLMIVVLVIPGHLLNRAGRRESKDGRAE